MIEHVVWNPNLPRHTTRVVHIVERAAASMNGLRHAFTSCQAALVPQLHGQPYDVVTLRAQHGRNGGRIHTARHRHRYGLTAQFVPPYVVTARLSYVGERSRNRETVEGIRLSAKAISASVVCFPRLNRMLPRAWSGRSPIAINTCDGSIAPDEHAAPVETASPFRSSAMTSASPSMWPNLMFVVFGTRAAPVPFTCASSICSRTLRSTPSRIAANFSVAPLSRPFFASLAASPNPT